MDYSFSAGRRQDYCNNIEAIRSVFNVTGGKKITCGSGEFFLFGRCNRRFSSSKFFIGSGFDLDEDYRAVSIGGNKVNLTGFAGEIAGKDFKAAFSEEFFAASLTPLAEHFAAG